MNDRHRPAVPDTIPAELHAKAEDVIGHYNPAVPPHCPFRFGDRIHLAGHPQAFPPGLRQTGFTGWVLGTIGATILVGITTTGRDWAEYWGNLHRTEPVAPSVREKSVLARHRRPAEIKEQLDLFAEPDDLLRHHAWNAFGSST
jgi:hypothetical protein